MLKKKVFISFSSKNQTEIREIISALEQQQIDIWDYSERWQEIPLGENVLNELKRQIDGCDYFIPVISSHSMSNRFGKFTKEETVYALSVLRPDQIIPVLLLHDPPGKKWTGPFASLQDRCHIEIDTKDVRGFINAIERLCREMDIRYLTPFRQHPRMPFWEKFRNEAYALSHSVADHGRLMMILTEFNHDIELNDWESAYFLIQFFLQSVAYNAPNADLFYAWIVRGVCEQQLNLWDEAEYSYKQAMKTNPGDENVYGGLGDVYKQRGDLDAAIRYYRKSLDCVKGKYDFDEKFNLIVVLLDAGLINQIDDSDRNLILEKKFVPGPNKHIRDIPDDARKTFINTQARLYLIQGEADKAAALLQSLLDDGDYDTVTILTMYQYYTQNHKPDQAEKLLKTTISESKNNTRVDQAFLRHLLCNHLFGIQQYKSAKREFEKLLQDQKCRSRQRLIGYARTLRKLKQWQEMKQTCRDVLYVSTDVPQTREDFYYSGFAQFLLGNYEPARYDYERSQKYDVYYDEFDDLKRF